MAREDEVVNRARGRLFVVMSYMLLSEGYKKGLPSFLLKGERNTELVQIFSI